MTEPVYFGFKIGDRVWHRPAQWNFYKDGFRDVGKVVAVSSTTAALERDGRNVRVKWDDPRRGSSAVSPDSLQVISADHDGFEMFLPAMPVGAQVVAEDRVCVDGETPMAGVVLGANHRAVHVVWQDFVLDPSGEQGQFEEWRDPSDLSFNGGAEHPQYDRYSPETVRSLRSENV